LLPNTTKEDYKLLKFMISEYKYNFNYVIPELKEKFGITPSSKKISESEKKEKEKDDLNVFTKRLDRFIDTYEPRIKGEIKKDFQTNLLLSSRTLNDFKQVSLLVTPKEFHKVIPELKEKLGKDIETFSKNIERLISIEEQKIKCVQNNTLLKNIPNEFKNARSLVLAMVKPDDNNLKHISQDLQNVKPIVLKCVKYDSDNIKYATKYAQDDFDIGTECVSQKGENIRYLSKRLRDDKDIAMEAIKNDTGLNEFYVKPDYQSSFEFLSSRLQTDKDILLESVTKGLPMEKIPNYLKNKYGYDKNDFLDNLKNDEKYKPSWFANVKTFFGK
jgi:hypothetical protein